MKTKWLKTSVLPVGMACIMLLTTSCGTILHPERKGQISGRIDPAIAILDGIGLLCFLIPGVIAFAVDFSNGTIYLPPGEANLQNSPDALTDMLVIRVDKGSLTTARIEELVREHTGKNIDLNSPDVVITRVDDLNDARTTVVMAGL